MRHDLRRRPMLETLEDRTVPSIDPGIVTVNTSELGTGNGSRVITATASAANGMSVVVWSNPHDGQSDVLAQLYAANGQTVGGEITVAGTGSFEGDPAVAMDADGNFVVSWTLVKANGDRNVQAARFNNGGGMEGASFNVASTSKREDGSSVATAPDGSFAIAFTRVDSGTGQNIVLKRYDSDGVAFPLMYVAKTTKNELNPSVAYSKGTDFRFSVAYQVGYDIWLKRYSEEAKLLGTHTLANTKRNESVPSLAMDKASNNLVAWQDFSGQVWSVRARKVSNKGVLGKTTPIKNGVVSAASKTNYTKPAAGLDPKSGAFAVVCAKTVTASAAANAGGNSVAIIVTEVLATGHLGRSYTVDTLVPASQGNSQDFTNQVYARISVNGTGHYTISYGAFGDDADPATVRKRTGKLP